MTDRTHFFAVALAVLVTAGFTVGCANGSSTGAPSAAELANAEATYTGVINQVYGTPTQRKAAAERGWLQTQTALATCMRETGERYPVSPYPASIDSAGFPTPGDLLAFLPVGDDFGIRQRKEAKAAGGEPRNPVFNPLKATAEHKEYMQKLQGCQSAAKPFETSEVLTVRDRLAVKLGESLAVVQESASVASLLEDYGTCLTAHGIDITNREALYLSVSRAYPVAETATTDVRKDPRWATAITYERKAAEADKWCRRDSVDAARVAAVPALQQFVTANKTDLLANQSKWSVIEAEVKRLQVKAALF